MFNVKAFCPECDNEFEEKVTEEEIIEVLNEIIDNTNMCCNECGRDLDYGVNGNEISIGPCEYCIEGSYEDGKLEGYEYGYDAGHLDAESEFESEPQSIALMEDEKNRIRDLGYEEGYADAQKEKFQ